MADENISAATIIRAPAQVIFAVLADPTTHPAIDGTGWVCEAVDTEPLTAAGQVFHMGMYHPKHPNGNYEMANQIQAIDPPSVISWKPGYYTEGGKLDFGGWVWRYDLTPIGPSETKVSLTYDWSAVSDVVRERIGFPPFDAEHLTNSLDHLAKLAAM